MSVKSYSVVEANVAKPRRMAGLAGSELLQLTTVRDEFRLLLESVGELGGPTPLFDIQDLSIEQDTLGEYLLILAESPDEAHESLCAELAELSAPGELLDGVRWRLDLIPVAPALRNC